MAPQTLLSTVWAYNSRTGSVISETTAEFDLASSLGIGWHGPFSSKQAALDYYTANKANNPGWKAPAGILPALGNAVTNNPVTAPVTNAVGQAWDAATALPRFLSMLTTGNFWLRVAEVISGLVLLAIGANALFKGKPLKAVTKTAGMAAKVVPV